MHTYILHIYIHAYIRAYIYTYMHTCVHTYIHTCMHAYIHTYIHVYTYIIIHTYTLQSSYFNMSMQFCRISISVASVTVSGCSDSKDSPGTSILYQPDSGPTSVQQQYETEQPVVSAEFTLSHDHTADRHDGREGEGSASAYDHRLKLRLQQTVLVVDKATVLKAASLISRLSGSFNTE